jgi:peptidoglycan/LPS O-acetylase OafA/YrhL
MVNIFATPIFSEFILPFLLVFVVVFAILQKAKILGDNKTQIDSLVALVVALLLIIAPTPRNFIVDFTPWVAVGIAVLLVFFLLYGFVAEDKWKQEKWVKIVFGILAGLFVIVLVFYFSGVWKNESLKSIFSLSESSGLWSNILLILIIGGAMAIALSTGKKEKKPGSG